MPTLLTAMSMPPKPASACATRFATCAWSDTSAIKASDRTPRSRTSAATRSTATRSRWPLTTILAPASANASARARPILRPDPVTSAVRPCKDTRSGGRTAMFRPTASERSNRDPPLGQIRQGAPGRHPPPAAGSAGSRESARGRRLPDAQRGSRCPPARLSALTDATPLPGGRMMQCAAPCMPRPNRGVSWLRCENSAASDPWGWCRFRAPDRLPPAS